MVFPLAEVQVPNYFQARSDGRLVYMVFLRHVCLTQKFKISDVFFQIVVRPHGSWFLSGRRLLWDMETTAY